MCGIAGLAGGWSDPREHVARMLGLLRHRGPDDEGAVSIPGGAFGVRRLAIIDLARGHQPMANEDGSVWAVQNGELYNFRELRDELVRQGHRFSTESDTEIIPHLYEEHGPTFAKKLRGMFAIAVHDRRRGSLVLTRDRVGKKPLYYAYDGTRIAFASEIQPLLALGVDRAPDDEAVSEYLALGYIGAPRSGFKAIRKVRPAHVLTFGGGHVDEAPYWRLAFAPKLAVTEDEALDLVRSKLDEAVRLRRISDVPLGVFLSGGLDSSTVVAFMAAQGGLVRTYSIGFGDKAFDELAYSRVVAERFGTDHHEHVVEPDAGDVLPELVTHFGEPFADASAVPTYYVARMARRDVTVALNGDGGDEVFGGYERYRGALLAARLDALPRPLRVGISLAAGRVPRHWLPRRIGRLRQFALTLGMPAPLRYRRWVGLFPPGSPIRGPRLAADAGPAQYFAEALEDAADADPLDELLAIDMRGYLPGDLLVKMDIATMASSLEARSPFLDHELVELVARLPANLKIRGGHSKYLLRRLMKGVLPDETLQRPKMGFGLPVGSWIRGAMREQAHEAVAALQRRGYIDPLEGIRLLNEHESRRADHGLALWSLVALDLWFRYVVDADAPASEARGSAP